MSLAMIAELLEMTPEEVEELDNEVLEEKKHIVTEAWEAAFYCRGSASMIKNWCAAPFIFVRVC